LHEFFDASLKLFSGVSRLLDWFTRGGSGLDKALTGENFTDGPRFFLSGEMSKFWQPTAANPVWHRNDNQIAAKYQTKPSDGVLLEINRTC
jgi:hypothetical protein